MTREATQSSSACVGTLARRVVMLYGRHFEPYEGRYLRSFNEAKTLAEAGCEVTVVAWDRSADLPPEEDRGGVHIRRIPIKAPTGRGPLNGANVLRFNRAALALLLKLGFDIVHCFNVDTMFAGLMASRLRRTPAVLDLCEPDYYRGFWKTRHAWLLRAVDRVERLCSRRFDHVFVHDTYQLEKFRSYGISRLTQIGSYPNRSLLSQKVKEGGTDPVVVGRIGSVYANNGFEEIAQAFRLLRERSDGGGQCRYRFLIAGRVFDSFRRTFESLVAPFDDCLELMGTYGPEDLPDLYRKIDISLLLYGRQWFANITPTKLFESMALGVPVVANTVGDMGAIVGRMKCGVIVDETDPASICEGVERLGTDTALRRAMAETGLRLVRDRYCWEAQQDAFLAVYRSL